jgi:hypothetical protein
VAPRRAADGRWKAKARAFERWSLLIEGRLARLRARLMADRQDYLRQLIAQLDVVLPEHRAVLGDLLTAWARGILTQFPTAQHLANANPRAIRRAAEDGGARGFSLDARCRLAVGRTLKWARTGPLPPRGRCPQERGYRPVRRALAKDREEG